MEVTVRWRCLLFLTSNPFLIIPLLKLLPQVSMNEKKTSMPECNLLDWKCKSNPELVGGLEVSVQLWSQRYVCGFIEMCLYSLKGPGQHLASDLGWGWVSEWLGHKAGLDLASGRNCELRKNWLLAEFRAGITQCVRRAETNNEHEKVHERRRSEWQNHSASSVWVNHNISVEKLKQFNFILFT